MVEQTKKKSYSINFSIISKKYKKNSFPTTTKSFYNLDVWFVSYNYILEIDFMYNNYCYKKFYLQKHTNNNE